MSNKQHLKVLVNGETAWNTWRMEHSKVRPDLQDADLADMDLRNFDLSGCNLTQAILRAADIRNAGLGGACLVGADLSEANLRGARLTNGLAISQEELGGDPSGAMHNLVKDAHFDGGWFNVIESSGAGGYYALPQVFVVESQGLSHTSLRHACLDGADFRGTIIAGVDMYGASVTGSMFGDTTIDAELNGIKGLDDTNHSSRSYLSLRALGSLPYPSPEVFLRGVGLSDMEIEFAKLYKNDLSANEVTDIVYHISELKCGKAIQYYSCFISYSSSDERFATKLQNDLQERGVRCWFAPKDMQSGKKIHHQIGDAIRFHDKLLLVLSRTSVESNWVETEIRRARKQERKEGCQKLFPLRLIDYDVLCDWELFDADEGRDLAREVREYFIPDFSSWEKIDLYNDALEKLLHDLQLS